jgi:hypothetical protein
MRTWNFAFFGGFFGFLAGFVACGILAFCLGVHG